MVLPGFDSHFFQSGLSAPPLHIIQAPSRAVTAMKCLISSVLLLCLLVSVASLSVGEHEALEQFLQNFPSLALASPPWTSNISLACMEPMFYGLNCTVGDDPHVIEMYVTLLLFLLFKTVSYSKTTSAQLLNASQVFYCSRCVYKLASIIAHVG